MSEAKNENDRSTSPDRSRELLEQLEPRRIIPRSVRRDIRGLLVQEEGYRTKRESGGLLLERIPEEEKGKIPIEGAFTPDSEDRETLTTLEKDIVAVLIRDAVKQGRDAVASFKNIYPYDTRYTVDVAVNEMNDLIEDVEGLGVDTERSETVLNELNKIKEWFEGNKGLLSAGGTTLQTFYDGLATMAGAVRTNPRHNMTATELDYLYSSVSKIEGWDFGKEIADKQDQIHSIMRGIAAAHRYKYRNGGSVIENDYPVTDAQAEFVYKVFGKAKEVKDADDPSGRIAKVSEEVTVIDELVSKADVIAEIENLFSDSANENYILQLMGGQKQRVTENWLKGLRSNLKKYEEQTVWVDGVPWPINLNTLTELEWKVDSGDEVFISKNIEVGNDDVRNIDRILGGVDFCVASRRVPASLDNLYVVAPVAEKVEEIKQKMLVMMDMEIWERLARPGVDLSHELARFEGGMARYESKSRTDKILNEHILEMARIYLLYSCEGARLGWGFDYEFDDKLGVYKRSVSTSGSEVSTDISTPFFWLYTEANNGWKDWTHGTLPMNKRTQRQIREHEPGWKPSFNKATGRWGIYTYLGGYMEFDAPTKFDLSLLDSLAVSGGEYHKKKGMELIQEGKKMSELPWKNFSDMGVNRWYITMSQLAMQISLLSGVPTKDLAEKFFGPDLRVPRMSEIFEFMKRETLAHRDAAKVEDVEKFMPLSTSLYLAYTHNLLLSSPQPGRWLSGEVKKAFGTAAMLLEGMRPEGNWELSQKMAARLVDYSQQFLKLGEVVAKQSARISSKAKSRIK